MRRHLAAAAWILCLAGSPVARAGDITLEQRIAHQTRIEQVSWDHTIWPEQNSRPKPSLLEVLPEADLRGKVEDYLLKSRALEQYWKRPVVAEQLQAEMDRMAAGTRQPDVLRQLFAALDDEPRTVAECLARPVLVDRLIRNWYARDERFHGDVRAAAEEALARGGTLEQMKVLGANYTEVDVVGEGSVAEPSRDESDPQRIQMDADRFRQLVSRLAAALDTSEGVRSDARATQDRPGVRRAAASGTAELIDRLPTGRLTRLIEEDDGFVVHAVIGKTAAGIRLATARWPKRSFESWWHETRLALTLDGAAHEEAAPLAAVFDGYALPALPESSCTADTWSSTRTEVPDPRGDHVAVWTGTEMIVWGGYNGVYRNTGGKYNPSTDTWTATSMGANVPAPRGGAVAVWSGTQMIVWGGSNGSYLNTGGCYTPGTDTWTATSMGANVPAARSDHAAVWSGTEMIVWGGTNGSASLNTGARYDPSSNAWAPTATGANLPQARSGHTAVWSSTTSAMIVWGGVDSSSSPLNTGGQYKPSTNSWTATSTGTNCPEPVAEHSAVWSGTQMIVWGGASDFLTDTAQGGRYNPSTNAWTTTSTTNAPAARRAHSAVWTGSVMIVFGGNAAESGTVFNTGGRYNPSNNSWTPTSTAASVPGARYGHTAVWTGTDMIVWGGYADVHSPLVTDTGGRYNPGSDSWVSTSTGASVPEARSVHTAVWTGSEMIVWGGNGGLRGPLNSGGRYAPATDSWSRTSTGTDVPDTREYHTAVWTGTEMVVWGGFNGATYLNTGGRYAPLSDTWVPTSTAFGVPAARQKHTAVWTGSEMIVWGGTNGSYFATGARYDPAADRWTATSTGTNRPEARFSHTAVWTGTQMIVWGGSSGSAFLNTGGVYTPATNSWEATSTGANLPAPRVQHTAIWTGTEMIVWGGFGAGFLNTGGRYDPVLKTWIPTSTGPNVPTGRWAHTAVWAGDQMIVWGGSGEQDTPVGNGGRYSPSDDGWSPMSSAGAPSARSYFTAVETGSSDPRMIVWGGDPITATGGLYCLACTATLWYLDADGDDHGNPAATQMSCGRPSGYSAAGDDCNDSDSDAWGFPVEVDNLVVTQAGSSTRVNWTSQDASGGPATVYDVPSGLLSQLIASGGYASASCAGAGIADTPFDDPRPAPGAGDGYHYLTRARNSCATGTYGDSGLSPDPRDALDSSGPCP